MTDSEDLTPETTADDVAKWLFDEIQKLAPQAFKQKQAVARIRHTFGEEWSVKNPNGNHGIRPDALKEFQKYKATDPNIQWIKSNQSWERMTDEKLDLHLKKEALRKEKNAERKRLKEARLMKN